MQEAILLMISRRVFLQDAAARRTTLEFARLPWYSQPMNTSVRRANCKHMTRFGWAVEGVAR
jgi:hypothetical protein